MNTLLFNPIITSLSLFGMTALLASVAYSFFEGSSLLNSDDPYIIGFALAAVNALAAFMYFLFRTLNLKWINPHHGVIAFYSSIVAYCLYVEAIGGEASGWGYLFLSATAATSPILIGFIYYSKSIRVIYAGIVFGVIYGIGYVQMFLRNF